MDIDDDFTRKLDPIILKILCIVCINETTEITGFEVLFTTWLLSNFFVKFVVWKEFSYTIKPLGSF